MTGPAVVRRALVEAPRIHGWVRRFDTGHEGAVVSGPDAAGVVTVTGGDGCVAHVRPVVVPAIVGGQDEAVAWLGGTARLPDQIAVVGIRRAEYVVALVVSGTVVTAKHGRRHVQGRTAAGGWSQQRFARRRENAASELVEDVVGHVVTLVVPRLGPDVRWVGAGDRGLVSAVLEAPPLRRVVGPTSRPDLDLVDAAALDAAFVRRLPAALGALEVRVREVAPH